MAREKDVRKQIYIPDKGPTQQDQRKQVHDPCNTKVKKSAESNMDRDIKDNRKRDKKILNM